MNIPIFLTLVRIMVIPVVIITFYLSYHWAYIVTAVIFACAAITDWLDGYLARTLSQTSRLGAFLDPVADKLIVVAVLLLLVGESNLPYITLPAIVIVGREIVVSALREWMAEIGQRASVAVSYVAKIKTTAQMVAILLMLLGRPGSPWHHVSIEISGYVLLYIAAVLTLWTMLMYIKASWYELVKP
jgi:CDP-diacylglycerol--glycerol-3-phosphate 3-phosphatidyltransferase